MKHRARLDVLPSSFIMPFSVLSDKDVTTQRSTTADLISPQEMNSPLNAQPKARACPLLKERSMSLGCLTTITTTTDTIAPHIR
jgi:hypothetical protein